MKIQIVMSLLFFLCFGIINAREFAVITMPVELVINEGRFVFDKKHGISFDKNNAELKRIAGFLNDHMISNYGFPLEFNTGIIGFPDINFLN